MIDAVKIIHVVAPYHGDSPLFQRQQLFLESIDGADRHHVSLLALVSQQWCREGWQVKPMMRDARAVGDPSRKPFIKDLYNLALDRASPSDWLLYTNTDCAIDPQLYQHLRSLSVTAVEYMRQDVDGDPATLDELFSNRNKIYTIGLDGLALRAGLWAEIGEHLPDFLIGEPHWDTTYSGILRRIIPVWRDQQLLYHPRHQPVWNMKQPTPGGQHNHMLFVDAVGTGHSATSLIGDQPNCSDTAVITISFGNDPVRIKANITGLSEQLKQDLYCDFYLLEAVPEGGKSAYPSDLLARLNHIPIQACRASEGLFQKESLMNLGWRMALVRHNYDYFIFPDADIHARQLDWFRQIRSKLQHNPARAVQGFRMVRDTLDRQLHYSSLASAYMLDHPTDLALNPGLCWGLHRIVLEAGDGFNAFCIECSGDSALVAEYINWDYFQYDPHLYQFDWFTEIERDLPFRIALDCVAVDIIHVHHGYLNQRNYDGVRYAIDGLPPLVELVERDSNGLLCWIDEAWPERRLMAQRDRMSSRAAVDRLFEELGYRRYQRKRKIPRRSPANKPLFKPVDAHHQLNSKLPEQPLSDELPPRDRLNLFNPVEVFRQDFPFSWCDGVKRLPGSSFIPIGRHNDTFSLILDSIEGAEYIIGVIPIQPSWESFDLSSFLTLNLTIKLVNKVTSDVMVQLEGKDEAGITSDSAMISLIEKGIEPGESRQIAIPLVEFIDDKGFKLNQSRLLKAIAGNGCRMELSRVYIS